MLLLNMARAIDDDINGALAKGSDDGVAITQRTLLVKLEVSD